jgi:hypothetical protein
MPKTIQPTDAELLGHHVKYEIDQMMGALTTLGKMTAPDEEMQRIVDSRPAASLSYRRSAATRGPISAETGPMPYPPRPMSRRLPPIVARRIHVPPAAGQHPKDERCDATDKVKARRRER